MPKTIVAKSGKTPKYLRPRVLFARVGSMKYYSGPRAGDDRPKGGGRYNRKNVGHEVFNFSNFDGRLYGFVRAKGGHISLVRIDPTANQSTTLDDVLVIFVAQNRIVGWYRDARVHKMIKNLPRSVQAEIRKRLVGYATMKFKLDGYLLESNTDRATLLPTEFRTFKIPSLVKGGFGQSNICYSYEKNGKQKDGVWMNEAIKFVVNYEKGNLLQDPYLESSAGKSGEIAQEQAAGFQSNIPIRQAIEQHSMTKAKEGLRKIGYSEFENTSASKPYDYTCAKNGTIFYVEVKGTQTAGRSVILTKNEVEHATANPDTSILVVLHSVEVKGKKKISVTGGSLDIREKWKLEANDLTPIQYRWAVK